MHTPDEVFVAGKKIAIDFDQLLQSGGEGMVFAANGGAIKLYYRRSSQQTAKLRHFLQKGFRLPECVLAPRELAVDGRGHLLGFQMARLPASSQPFKQLSNPHFCIRMGLDVKEAVALLLQAHRTLQEIHQAGLVVGDLNDLNLHFLPEKIPDVYWIDVDSYQWDKYPCPVAALPFLDPRLYDVGDLRQAPSFTFLTDWYAFSVLVIRTLLHVHPYGGVHSQFKTLQARAQAGITVLGTGVTYPPNARPLAALSDDLLHQTHLTFEKGQRVPFPAPLLVEYAENLTECERCKLAYPAFRAYCPSCARSTRQIRPARRRQTMSARQPFSVNGALLQLAVQADGGIDAFVRRENGHYLIRGNANGSHQEMLLFRGQGGYRLGYFGETVVVNACGSQQLLLLDVSGSAPRSLGMWETARFGAEAVFGTTPSHLYRIANGYILQGQVRYGRLVEEIVATAHRNQTTFWASPVADRLAGYHRIFEQYRLFLLDQAANSYDVALPAGAQAGPPRNLTPCFGQTHLAFLWQTGPAGRVTDQTHVVLLNMQGQHCYYQAYAADLAPFEHLEGCLVQDQALLHPTDQGLLRTTAGGYSLLTGSVGLLSNSDRLHWHPSGLLVQRPTELLLLAYN